MSESLTKGRVAAKASTELQKLDLEIKKLEVDIDQQSKSTQILDNTLAYGKRVDSIYMFRGGVDWDSLNSLYEKIAKWEELKAKGLIDEVVVSITSPGGSVFSGFGHFDLIRNASDNGLHIETEVLGYAGSMGSVLAQAGTVRTIRPHSWLMLHEIAGYRQEWMQLQDLREQVELFDDLQERLLGIYCERSAITPEDIRTKTFKHDWWISANEALDLGLVDEIKGKRVENAS